MAAAVVFGVVAHQFDRGRRQRAVHAALMNARGARLLFRGAVEAGIGHAERREHVGVQIGRQGLAAQRLDQQAHPIGVHAVFPARAGVAHQRHTQPGLLAAEHALPPRGFLVALEVGVPHFVGEAGRVGQQLAGGDRAFHGAQPRLAAVVETVEHFDAGEFGQDFAGGLVQPELPPLVQLHERDGGDGLGHGRDPKDRVRGHGRFGAERPLAERALVHDARIVGDRGDHPRQVAGLDGLLQYGVNGLHGGAPPVRSRAASDGRAEISG